MSSPTCRDMSVTFPANAEHDLGRIFEFAEEWCDMGRPKIMNDDEVDLFTESVCRNPGEKTCENVKMTC